MPLLLLLLVLVGHIQIIIAATSFAAMSRQAQVSPMHYAKYNNRSRRRQYENPLAASRSSSHLPASESSTSSFCVHRPSRSQQKPQQQSRTSSQRQAQTCASAKPPQSLLYFIKVGLAGGLAGAVGTTLLYPVDVAKTLRQSQPSKYKSVFAALASLVVHTKSPLANLYRGVLPSAVGAIPSSALYFGAYESMKYVLTQNYYNPQDDMPSTTTTASTSTSTAMTNKNTNFHKRLLVHALAAMSGNVLSSAIFVPKELIKQQLQYRQTGNVVSCMTQIVPEKGLGGLYVGYKATLLRNIPTAVLRFGLYEEFRYRWYTTAQPNNDNTRKNGSASTTTVGFVPKFFLAGACAGLLASGVMTPVDVLKTRLATGTCPVDVKSCFLHVLKTEGMAGLYSGAGSRMVFSGAFSAIGFGTFEWAKGLLGVEQPPTTSSKQNVKPTASNSKTGSTNRHHASTQRQKQIAFLSVAQPEGTIQDSQPSTV